MEEVRGLGLHVRGPIIEPGRVVGFAGDAVEGFKVHHGEDGLAVRDYAKALDWYGALFGRPADEVVDEEAMWQLT